MLLFLQHLFPLILEVAGGGMGAWFFTEAAKRSSWIPIDTGQTIRLRAFAAICSAILGVLVAFTNKELTGEVLQQSFLAIVSAGTMWYTAHTIHASIPTVPPTV